MDLATDHIANTLRTFKERRDSALHEDADVFHYHLQRFSEFCQGNTLIQSILMPLRSKFSFDAEIWWKELQSTGLQTPSDPDEEFALFSALVESTAHDERRIYQLGSAMRKFKHDERVELFRSLILRPFVDELGYRLSNAANLATPEERIMQAVPLNRIPRPNEIKIFLSHKTADKPTVYCYYHALKEVGFTPWLDDPDMPAGVNLERSIFKGFEESCAAVFFLTQHFTDEQYLATEIDYAIQQKRKKGEKFAIITLRYPDATRVPDLLTPYVYKTVPNDLEGFREILRSLPIEPNRILWRERVIVD